MTNYRIQAFYSTGDSNSTENTDTLLAPVWTDLDKAKKALQELREHHDYYDFDDKPRWYKGKLTQADLDNIASKPWHAVLDKRHSKSHHMSFFCAALELDDGTRMITNIPYHGYFENLQSLKIIVEVSDETDMEIHF